MNTVHDTAQRDSGSSSATSVARWAGWLSILQGLLLFVPTVVLGQAINWPASLDDPASEALPRLLENEGAVRFGYVAYLVYSVLFAVTIVAILRFTRGSSVRSLAPLIIAFAIASTVARSIGIVRWLAPMPELATLSQSATNDEQRYAVDVMFETLNSYGGTIGEVLGVSIFAFVTIFLLVVAALRDGSLPRWICVFGLVAALGVLATAMELFGIDPGPIITVGTTLVQLWFLAIGVWLLTQGRRRTKA